MKAQSESDRGQPNIRSTKDRYRCRILVSTYIASVKNGLKEMKIDLFKYLELIWNDQCYIGAQIPIFAEWNIKWTVKVNDCKDNRVEIFF